MLIVLNLIPWESNLSCRDFEKAVFYLFHASEYAENNVNGDIRRRFLGNRAHARKPPFRCHLKIYSFHTTLSMIENKKFEFLFTFLKYLLYLIYIYRFRFFRLETNSGASRIELGVRYALQRWQLFIVVVLLVQP